MNWTVMRIDIRMWVMSYVNNMASDQVKFTIAFASLSLLQTVLKEGKFGMDVNSLEWEL